MSDAEEFEEFKKFKSQQEEARKKAEEDAKIKAAVLEAMKAQMPILPEPPKFNASPKTLDELSPELKKEINIRVLNQMNDSQLPKIGIAFASIMVAGIAQFNVYGSLGVAFIFMLIGGGWFTLTSNKIMSVKKKYNI